jgi:hypothetical protein
MALQIEQQTRDIGVVRTTLGPERTRVVVRPGDSFRFIDDAGQPIVRAPRLRVRRLDNNLIIDGLPDGREVELNNFFGACRPGAECKVSLAGVGLPGAAVITEETPPTAALQDGSFLLYSDNTDSAALAALPAAKVADAAGPSWLAIGIAAAAAGGGGGDSGPAEDTTAPGAPRVTSGSSLRRTAAIVTGEAEAGARVTLRVDANGNGFDPSDLTFVTTADGQGRWSIDLNGTPQSGTPPAGGLVAGQSYALEVRATDAALNASDPARSAVTLVAPDAPVIRAVAGDDLVNAAERAAGVTVAGSAQAGTTVTVRIGSASASAATDASGEWRVTFSPSQLPQSGQASIQATASDAIGPGATASRSVAFDTIAPGAPVIGIVAGDDIVNAAENAAGIVVQGTAEAGATVDLRFGGTSATAIANAAGTWSLPLAASQLPSSGLVTFTASAIDPAGNTGPSSTRQVLFETTAPGAPVITDNVPGTATGPVTFTFTFERPITGFVASDIQLTGGAPGAFTAVSTSVYTLVVTPTASTQAGQIIVTVPAGAGSDLAGNPTVAATTIQAYDTAPPTVVITNDAPASPPTNGPVNFTFTFSEAVTGFAAGDITVSPGATVSGFSGSGTTYTAQVLPAAGTAGTLTVGVAAGVAADAVGQPNVAGSDSVVAFDRLAPTLAITDSVAGTAGPAGVVFTFTFSEPVSGFTVADIALAGGQVGEALTGFATLSPSVYTATYVPTVAGSSGTATVTVATPLATIADLSGNAYASSAAASQAYERIAPTVAITDNTPGSASGPVTFTFTFSEPVTGFVAGDIVSSLGASSVTGFAGSGTTYTAVITPPTGASGSFTVDVPAAAASDLAGNPSAAAPQASQPYLPADSIAPTLTITDDQPGTLNNTAQTVVFTFSFSEPVTGFDRLDVVVAGGLGGTPQPDLTVVTPGQVWTMSFTAAPNTAGLVGVTVGTASGIIDGVGNPLAAAASGTQAFDRISPTATITDSAPGSASGPVVYTFTFNEAVTGFDAGDITVSGGGGPASLSGFTVDSATVYRVTYTPPVGQTGTAQLSLGSGLVLDAADNGNTASQSTLQPYDRSVVPVTATVNLTPGPGVVAPGSTSSDTTPQVVLTLGAVLASGETLTLRRDGTDVASITSGTTLTFNEPTPGLSAGPHDYTAVVTGPSSFVTLDLDPGSPATAYRIVI